LLIVEALNSKKSGLTRKEIIEKTKLTNNGHTTNALRDLEESGFIKSYNSFPYSKNIYQLVDFFNLFSTLVYFVCNYLLVILITYYLFIF
jgi:hypothetical protein